MRPDKTNLLKKMKEANVSGVSIATFDSEEIYSIGLGTSNCSFYKMKESPAEEILKTFDSSRYILTPKGLFYYNQPNKEFQVVTTNKSKLNELTKYLTEDRPIFTLTDEQLAQITHITGHKYSASEINQDTVFGAASLSKPLFAYLVLKLIEENKSNSHLESGKFNLPADVAQFDLDTPLYKILPGLSEGGKQAEQLTARMVLAHTTGIPMSTDNKVPEFLFEPGAEYGYNGVPYFYLQMALEKLTGASLQELAQKHVFTPLKMNNSSFLRPEYSTAKVKDEGQPPAKLFPIDLSKFASISANSLRTTAGDYARFMIAWMHDEKLAHAFKSEIPMTKDQWAKDMALPEKLLEKITWGLGLGLQIDSEGQITAAFHSGDMNGWRAMVTINPQNKTGVVYFANSPNGDVLAEEITSGIVDAKEALSYIAEKYGFATKFEQDWEAKQEQRFDRVGYYFEALSGMHASEAEWAAEESDFQAHKDEYMKPVVEENVIRGDKQEKMKQFKQSFHSLKDNQEDSLTSEKEQIKSRVTPLKNTPKNPYDL